MELTPHDKGVYVERVSEDRESGKYDDVHPALSFPEGSYRKADSPGYKGNRKLYVVTCVSNPLRTRSRVELYKKFAQAVEDAGAILYTVEMAFGDRPHTITDERNPRHLQLRSYFELWHKENMLNLLINKLPEDWEYVAWIDADVMFTRSDWVNETIEQLQHYMVIQMFSYAQDLSLRYEPMQLHSGFVHDWYHGKVTFNSSGKGHKGKKKGYNGYGGYGFDEGHPGYAWAARREALDNLGGLIDFAILGSADRHMACALIGEGDKSFHPDIHPNYKELVMDWQDRAEKHIKHDIGYMAGTILHGYHGQKSKRGYNSRWQILVDHQYDPVKGAYRDAKGLLQLRTENIKLRDDLRNYFSSRHEDDTSQDSNKLLP